MVVVPYQSAAVVVAVVVVEPAGHTRSADRIKTFDCHYHPS